MTATKSQPRARVYSPPTTPEALLEGLNPEQAEVVKHHRGPLLVGAVAGAGKTTALVRRIAYLYRAHGVHPSEILAVTFSKKAATEMTSRLVRLLPSDVRSDARVGTLHSLALQFWREERSDARHWRVDDQDRYRTAVKDVLGFRGMNWDSADLTTVLQFIGLCKSRCALPGTPEAEAEAEAFKALKPCLQREPTLLCEAYARAESLRQERQLLTFDDMLLAMWDLMSRDERCRAAWARRWNYVLQDEAQDENLVQRRILEMLARDHRNYMVVGDPAQSIYGFRGSDPAGLLAFEGEWKAKKVLMERNYRSGPEILAAANGSLGAMPADTHLGMTIRCERAEPARVSVEGFADQDAEAQAVAQHVVEHHADGIAWKHHVVLYRTNAQSRALEEQFLGMRIPYVVIGGVNFYDRKEVKDLLSYLRIASGRGRFDDVRRSINSPFRYLGKAFVERIEREAEVEAGSGRDSGIDWVSIVRGLAKGAGGLQGRQRTSALEWCGMVDQMARTIAEARAAVAADPLAVATESVQEARPARLLEGVLQDTRYVQWLTRDEGTESPENNRVSNIRELVRASERFNTVDGLLDYIDETIEAARRAKEGADEDGVADRVTLMSIHRAKGLEWKVVFVVGANEEILPHSRCEDPNEERRLWYVAVTRARDVLHVSHVEQAAARGRVLSLVPSRFIEESGLVTQPEAVEGEEAAQ